MTKAFWVLLKRELGAIVLSPIAYVTMVLLYLVNGASFFMISMIVANSGALQNTTVMQVFFSWIFYWIILIVMIPVITMRLFSEEYKSGTIELLMTAPVTDWDVVMSKFAATLLFYIGLWVPTILYLLIFQGLTDYVVPVNWGPLLLSYGGIFLMGASFISVGLFTSVLTRNQIIAAFSSFAVIALVFLVGVLPVTPLAGMLGGGELLQSFLSSISIIQQMQYLTQGIFDSRTLVYHLSATILFLVLTQQVILVRKLKN